MKHIRQIPPLPLRPRDAHKGDFGKILIIAGSRDMPGAAALCGRSALRAGAGLVRVATAASAQAIVADQEPCYTTLSLLDDQNGCIQREALPAILEAAAASNCVAIGPGLGQGRQLRDLIERLIQQDKLSLVIDADGLNNLSRIKDWPLIRRAPLILTPHPGEMQRLWAGLFRTPLPEDRELQAQTLATETRTTVVLKGAGTLVCDGKTIYRNETGNPGMATAGSGDVLTGIITAFWGQGLSALDAAILGVYLHGRAGDIAAEHQGQISLIATDIIACLPQATRENHG